MARLSGVSLSVLMIAGMLLLCIPISAGGIVAAPRLPGLRNGTSSNWSGYAVTGNVGSVTDVKGSWIVPAIQGSCPAGSKKQPNNQYSSFWVGIDGYTSNTVEQTGTDSDCQNGKAVYYAWYEFYPQPSFVISSLVIHSGDVISAEVKYTSGAFTITITDTTTGKSFSASKKTGSAQRTSAEWIAEAPWSGGVLPLANFGTVFFSSCSATVGGVTGAIGSFGSAVQSITMVTSSGETKAVPSGLSGGGSSFTVTWASSGL